MVLISKRKNVAKIVAAASCSMLLPFSSTCQLDGVENDFPAMENLRDGLKSNLFSCAQLKQKFSTVIKFLCCLPIRLFRLRNFKLPFCSRPAEQNSNQTAAGDNFSKEMIKKIIQDALDAHNLRKAQKRLDVANLQMGKEEYIFEHVEQEVPKGKQSTNPDWRKVAAQSTLRQLYVYSSQKNNGQLQVEQFDACHSQMVDRGEVFEGANRMRFDCLLRDFANWDNLELEQRTHLLSEFVKYPKFIEKPYQDIRSKVVTHCIRNNVRSALQPLIQYSLRYGFPFEIRGDLKACFPGEGVVRKGLLLQVYEVVRKMEEPGGKLPGHVIGNVEIILNGTHADKVVRLGLHGKAGAYFLKDVHESQQLLFQKHLQRRFPRA